MVNLCRYKSSTTSSSTRITIKFVLLFIVPRGEDALQDETVEIQ